MFWAFRGYQTSFKYELNANFEFSPVDESVLLFCFALKILFYVKKDKHFRKHSTSFIEKQFNSVLKTLFLMKTMPGRDILLCVSYVS